MKTPPGTNKKDRPVPKDQAVDCRAGVVGTARYSSYWGELLRRRRTFVLLCTHHTLCFPRKQLLFLYFCDIFAPFRAFSLHFSCFLSAVFPRFDLRNPLRRPDTELAAFHGTDTSLPPSPQGLPMLQQGTTLSYALQEMSCPDAIQRPQRRFPARETGGLVKASTTPFLRPCDVFVVIWL